MINIKEILLNGGTVSLSYKENITDWVVEAKIAAFCSVFDMKPCIYVSIPTDEINGRKEFEYNDIDSAIELYEKLVFNKKNLWYKSHEAMINLYNKGIKLDLEIKKHFDIYEKERLSLINASTIF
jgi:hypothetical protein